MHVTHWIGWSFRLVIELRPDNIPKAIGYEDHSGNNAALREAGHIGCNEAHTEGDVDRIANTNVYTHQSPRFVRIIDLPDEKDAE